MCERPYNGGLVPAGITYTLEFMTTVCCSFCTAAFASGTTVFRTSARKRPCNQELEPTCITHIGTHYHEHMPCVLVQDFQERWAEYDDGSGTISPEQLQTLLIRTDPPLGLGRTATGRDVLKFVFNLDIPLVNGRVPFHRTVYELVRNVSETQIPEVKRYAMHSLHAVHS